MAIDINSVQLLLSARKRGASFGRVLMFGRQHLNVYPAKLAEVLSRHGLPCDEILSLQEEDPANIYSEPLFRALGATEVMSLDASAYQGSSVVHDMNRPIPDEMKAQFDIIYDGGSLEHVFNFPVALKNCMEMLKIGGNIFIHTTANNCFGHGFYQFSPEVFFRAFSDRNGFRTERLIVHRVGPYARWFEVSDPQAINSRVELICFYPVYMWAHAKRIHDAPIFAEMPQQSDLELEWGRAKKGVVPGKVASPNGVSARSRALGARLFPGITRLLHVIRIGVLFYRTLSLNNRRFFKPVAKD